MNVDEAVKNLISQEKPKILYSNKKIPDALILVIRNLICKSCGQTFEIPNHRIMYKFGETIVKPKYWLDIFMTLPRKFHKYREEIQCCSSCFETTNISSYDVLETE